jgi:hypothetical protein
VTGASCPASSSYTLTAPDWVTGPSDIQAVGVTDWVNSNGLKAKSPQIYAFAVPVDGSCPVTSVTLPDVGNIVLASPASAGLVLPAMHIFGVALRNTTTSTPLVSGSAQASPSQQAWTGAFESPVEDAFGPPSGYTWGNQTMRIAVSVNVGAPAGAQIRVRLTDPGFLSADGVGPLRIGAATIANMYGGPIPAQPPVPLTFGGASSATVPKGGDVYSDPLTLPFAVTAGRSLLVSVWLKNSSLPYLPVNSFSSGALTWFAAPSTPNQTADTSGTPFTAAGSTSIGAVPLLTGVDVTTASATMNGPNGSVTSPGAPTVVIVGDNVIDGWTSSALTDALNSPSKRLAGQLASQNLTPGYGVVDAGIASNQLTADSAPGGVSLAARLDRDILAEPDAGTVVIDQGLEDLLLSTSDRTQCVPGSTSCPMVDVYTALIEQLNAFGINVIVANLTPCHGYANSTTSDSCNGTESPQAEPARGWINDQIMGGQFTVDPYCGADLESAVGDGGSPMALQSTDATSDKVNLTWTGYAALAPAVLQGGQFCLGPGNLPLPPTP